MCPNADPRPDDDTERHGRTRTEAPVADAVGPATERADAATRDFLAAMSHEIRTPINAQLGYAELLDLELGGPLTPTQRGYVGRMITSGRYLLGLVDDLLILAAADAGRLRVAHERAVTGPAVAAALDVVRPQAAARGVQLLDLRAHDTTGEPFIGDELRVTQILVNLLSNAVKFSPSGGEVTVHCHAAERPSAAAVVDGVGPWTAITIEDAGIGIAPEVQERIFTAFVQAPGDAGSVYTRRPAGSGVGLSISRRLARLMAGDLTLDRSARGEGARFTLWLPAPADGERAYDRLARVERRTDAGAASGTGPGANVPAVDRRVATPRASTRTRIVPAVRVAELDALGALLRQCADVILADYVARLRTDPATADAARPLSRAQLEDHQMTFLADLAQSLIVVGDPATSPELAASLLADGSAIQRTVAEYHGRRRHAQGWSEAAVTRDHELLHAALEASLAQAAATGRTPCVVMAEAHAVLRQLIDRGRTLSLAGWRLAAGAR
ncbi:MAG: ATP-binding protein [Gemmatimonadaceae bacterium]|jgi:signal transduction histidine kinase|nr:ATP-binding protein [Gemmatimonadaceae bacterium]